jgi:hypothetical protein
VQLFGDNSSVNAFTAYERQFTVKGFISMNMSLNSKVVCKALATVDVGWVFHRSYHPKSRLKSTLVECVKVMPRVNVVNIVSASF